MFKITKYNVMKKKTTKKSKEPVGKFNFSNNKVINDIIEFHKVKDGCTVTLLILEAWLLWSIASNIF